MRRRRTIWIRAASWWPPINIPAMRCLLRAMEMGKGTSVYRESCQAVSMLYDYGWGVQKNVETARLWRVKSNE